MVDYLQKIINNSAVWDLHIHTCMCSKGSGEFSNLSVVDYVNGICEIFKSHADLQLVSFTDHNCINVEVYEEYIRRGSIVPFVVGVEVDTIFDKWNKEPKHLIVYFDINQENFVDYKEYIRKFNKKLNNLAIEISELLNYLIENKVNFVLSPHAFKQGNRGIDSDWNDEITTEEKAKKYMDQFYCFWEASGHSSVAMAEKFLRDFYTNDKISIVCFSDSNNFDKLNKYLSSPPQYFCSLPSFKGIQMVGTELSRILKNNRKISKNNYGNLIGSVNWNGANIEMSDKLNVIIGGRGSGKSLLLDSIGNAITDINIDSDRMKYISNFDCEVKNFNGDKIEKGNFCIDYIGQSFVSKLFNSQDYYKGIEDFFKQEFDRLPGIQVDEIKQNNERRFKDLISTFEDSKLGNISNLISKYKIINDNAVNISEKRNSVTKIKGNLDYFDVDDKYKKIMNLVSKELRGDPEIIKCAHEFMEIIARKIYDYNIKNLNDNLLVKYFVENYYEYKRNISNDSSSKEEIGELFVKTLDESGKNIKKRVNIVNAILSIEVGFEQHYEENILISGEDENSFRISNNLDVESPIDYFMRKCHEYFYVDDFKDIDNIKKIRNAINMYCYSESTRTKEGKSLDDFDKEMIEFSLEYKQYPKIEYKQYGVFEDVEGVSPGTQTNILMEYLVYKETSVPLLIDQPEDNVDNFTIFNVLREWFKNLKNKRQVIVVTHDANLVVNADAENIIVANHETKDGFCYDYGALEYGENLDVASKILDGGKEAVKRRLLKYGE